MKTIVGLDIGSYALKIAQMSFSGNTYKLDGLGFAYNPIGQFLPKTPDQSQQLAGAIKSLFTSTNLSTDQVLVSIPESMAFTNIIRMPILTDAELSSAIQWEAEQYIPVALNEVNLEYAVLSRPKRGSEEKDMKVLLAAVKKETTNAVLDLTRQSEINIVSLETNSLALVRVYAPKSLNTGSGLMVCHIGALSIEMVMILNGIVSLSYSIPVGGLALTRSIEKTLQIQPKQAEEHKRNIGLQPDQLEGKLKYAMSPLINSILGEMRKAIHFFSSENKGVGISTIILSGTSAYIPGLLDEIQNSLSIETMIGNPFEGIQTSINLPPDPSTYSIAVGLGLNQSVL